jgi:hypothetical protein
VGVRVGAGTRAGYEAMTSRLPTPWMVHCATHGIVYLTFVEYDAQVSDPDSSWVCPVCGEDAVWDDANYKRRTQGEAG